jgi:hypothetical protein
MPGVKDPRRTADVDLMAWWGWLLIGWFGVAALLGLTLGRAIGIADERELGLAVFQDGARATSRRPSSSRASSRRRRLPLPALAVPLAGVGVTLEAVGFVLRAAGHERGTARLLSMDLPLSVPRLYVTALFAAAAVAAVLGGARSRGRRTWWFSVAAVAAVVAEVKAGGTVHVRAVAALGLSGRPVLAALVSTGVIAVVLAALFLVSRTERRDRRRVLSALALYGLAAIGLSAVSSMAGGNWATAATFVEESGEVLGGVAVLVAVLAGVAPRLVLPADWALRRTADSETVDAPGALPTWQAGLPDLRG